MKKSMNRFKLCDLRFHPFVRKVIERLPDTVRENILNDKSFQIITDDDVFDGCVYRFIGRHTTTKVCMSTSGSLYVLATFFVVNHNSGIVWLDCCLRFGSLSI